MPRFTADTAAAMGAKGGRATVARHGRAHMAAIGVRGFWRTVLRHWGGDPRAYVNYLIALGIAATDAAPANGAFEHRRAHLRLRALDGSLAYVRPRWRPPAFPADMEPPF